MKKVGKSERYVVIGGQYTLTCYGVRDTLHAAKVLASAHPTYWDNWQGWHYPAIYRVSDCVTCNLDGNVYPAPSAIPVATRGHGDRQWTVTDDDVANVGR